MNNKAVIELSIGTMVILVLSMSMLILGMVLVKNIFYPEPEFRITIEEIEAEYIINNTVNCSYWTPLIQDKKDEINTLASDCDDEIINNSIPVCRITEMYFYIELTKLYEKRDSCIYRESLDNHKISKENITIKWLEENCKHELLKINNFTKGKWDCNSSSISVSETQGYHWRCFDNWKNNDIVYLNTNNINVEGYAFNRFIFSEDDIPSSFKKYSNYYQCGEYTVEVLA